MDRLFREADTSGVTVEYCRVPLNESLSVQDDDGDFILMDYSLIDAGAKERVHLAHEMGHCITGSFYNCYAAADIRQQHENRADKWAIKELVPEDELEKAIACGYTEPWELAEQFNVTEGFMKKAMCWYQYGTLAVEGWT